jgi:hypothetical protein
MQRNAAIMQRNEAAAVQLLGAAAAERDDKYPAALRLSLSLLKMKRGADPGRHAAAADPSETWEELAAREEIDCGYNNASMEKSFADFSARGRALVRTEEGGGGGAQPMEVGGATAGAAAGVRQSVHEACASRDEKGRYSGGGGSGGSGSGGGGGPPAGAGGGGGVGSANASQPQTPASHKRQPAANASQPRPASRGPAPAAPRPVPGAAAPGAPVSHERRAAGNRCPPRPCGPCDKCHATETPQWRQGPPSYPVLCNACGMRFRRGAQLAVQAAQPAPLHVPAVRSHKRQGTEAAAVGGGPGGAFGSAPGLAAMPTGGFAAADAAAASKAAPPMRHSGRKRDADAAVAAAAASAAAFAFTSGGDAGSSGSGGAVGGDVGTHAMQAAMDRFAAAAPGGAFNGAPASAPVAAAPGAPQGRGRPRKVRRGRVHLSGRGI